MIGLALSLVAAVAPLPAATELVLDKAIIANLYPAGTACGILKTWGAIDFTQDGVTHRVYALCGEARYLPPKGAVCVVRAREGLVDAYTFDGSKTPFRGPVIDGLQCDKPPADNRLFH